MAVKSRARRFPNSSKAEYRQLGCRSGLMQELSFSFRPAGPVSALEPFWRDLESRSDCSFFLSWDWIGCWLDEIDASPILVEGRAGDAVVVLGVFCPGAARPFAIRSVRLQETGQAEVDSLYIEYNGLLIDRRWAGIGERLCIEALLAEGARRGPPGGTVSSSVRLPNRWWLRCGMCSPNHGWRRQSRPAMSIWRQSAPPVGIIWRLSVPIPANRSAGRAGCTKRAGR